MSFKFEFQMNSCCMWGFSGVESIPLCLWVPIEKPSLTTSNALSNPIGLIALRRRLLARGARPLQDHLCLSGPGTGNRFKSRRQWQPGKDCLTHCARPSCACVCVSRRHVRVDGMPQRYMETEQEVGNWSQELRPRILHNTADFPFVNSFPNLD